MRVRVHGRGCSAQICYSHAVLGEGPVELGVLARVERGEVGGLEVACAAAAGRVQLVAADAKELARPARAGAGA